MFEKDALKLLHMMGLGDEIPGAMTAVQVPEALKKLQDAVALQKKKPEPEKSEDLDEEDEISIVQRAIPLMDLLTRAVDKKCAVMWQVY